VLLLSAVILLCFLSVLSAQIASQEGVAKDNADESATPSQQGDLSAPIRIQVLKLERPAFLESPKAVILKGKQSRRKTGWLELEVEWMWETRSQNPVDQFSSEFSIKYYVLLNNAKALSPKPTILTGEASYEYVQAGSPVRSVMYVSPRALDFLFAGRVPSTPTSAVINYGVVVSRGGQKMVGVFQGTPQKPFWEDPAAKTEADFKAGVLLRKAQTPFAYEAWDYYEQEKLDK
jgi:hypothetical protein